MPKKASQSDDWNFTVVPQRLHLPNGKPTRVFANVRTDTEQVLGTISETGYGLVQNFDFVNTIRTALASLGLVDYRENVLVTNEGRRLYATYDFDTRIKKLSKVGDQVGLVLRFATSFDGTVAALGELRGKILRCLNGMCMEKGKFSLHQRHTRKINLDFVQKVTAAAVNDFDRALSVFDALAGVAITDEQGVNILKRIKLSEAVREKIQIIWIQPNFAESRQRTLYTLYDAATEHLRDLEGSRFEQASNLNRLILRSIVRGLDSERLAEMVLPLPPKEDKTVIVSGEVPTQPQDQTPAPPADTTPTA